MPSDRDYVSTEDHEINYLLKKWNKKQSKKNREVLVEKLKVFKKDMKWKPHNRENFYKYVEENGIKLLLIDKVAKTSNKKEKITEKETAKSETKKKTVKQKTEKETVKKETEKETVKKETEKETIKKETEKETGKQEKKDMQLAAIHTSETKTINQNKENIDENKSEDVKEIKNKDKKEDVKEIKKQDKKEDVKEIKKQDKKEDVKEIKKENKKEKVKEIKKENKKEELKEIKKGKKKKYLIVFLVILALLLFVLVLISINFNNKDNKDSKSTGENTPEITKVHATSTPVNNDNENKDEINNNNDSIKNQIKDEIKDVISKNAPIYFITSSNLPIEGENKKLDEIIKVINSSEGLEIEVVLEGHTVSINQPEDEMNLSKERAEYVKDYMISKLTDKSIVINTKGFGSEASLDNGEQNDKNRCVEIKVVIK